jgi:S1-C subfamily serine protease
MKKNLRRRVLVAGAAAVLLVGGGMALQGVDAEHSGSNADGVRIRSVSLTRSEQPPRASSLTQTIKRVLPSVVSIHATQITSDPFGDAGASQAEGSGAILSANGLIVTNNHVVANATKVKVSFTDGREAMTGTVLGTDPQRDLALIKVSAHDLTPFVLGSSAKLRLGDSVTAIGFPLGLGGGPTVTRGIVSGLDRTISVSGGPSGTEHLSGMVQTDAAINPGNSGGPLIDADGHLVGLNSAAASAASAENTGFAIAIDNVIPVVKKLAAREPSRQAWLGVQIESLSPDIALQVGVPQSTRGALIVGVVPGSPAASSDLRRGDVITEVDGTTVTSPTDLTDALASHSAGDDVTLLVVRGEGEASVTVALGRRPPTLQG